VVSVRFRDEDGARACIARMEGRFFAGRRLSAALWDGVTNYNVKVRTRSLTWGRCGQPRGKPGVGCGALRLTAPPPPPAAARS
jgi:hypothetical protein